MLHAWRSEARILVGADRPLVMERIACARNRLIFKLIYTKITSNTHNKQFLLPMQSTTTNETVFKFIYC